MEATFNSDLLETYTDSQISTHGKWKIDLFLNRSTNFLELEVNVPRTIGILHDVKAFEKNIFLWRCLQSLQSQLNILQDKICGFFLV